MKKVLLPLVALLLTASAATAQTLQAEAASKRAPKATVSQSQQKAYAPTKGDATTLADNQRYIGNDGSDTPLSAVGVPGANIKEAGTIIPVSVLKNYAGDKIIGVRFCLATTIGSTTVRMYASEGQDDTGLFHVGDVLASKDVEETVPVTTEELIWNDVRFDTPYTIPANPQELLIGFDYTQLETMKSDGSDYTDECMPLWVNTTYGFEGGFLLNAEYTDSQTKTKGFGWVPVASGSSWVNLCLQVLVEREGGFGQDVIMKSFHADKFVQKENGTFDVDFSCMNDGSEALSSYAFGLAIDGTEIQTWEPTIELTNEIQNYQATGIRVPSDVEVGTHRLSLYVKSMNGGDPTGDLSNDTLYSTLRVYTDCMKKQKNLVEQFTSQGCSNCPYGYDVLSALEKSRDDLARVAIHSYYSVQGDDDYVCSDGTYITSYSVYGFPYASFNRYYINNESVNTNGSVGIPIGYTNYSEAAAYFSQFVDESNTDIPSFVNLNLTTNYNADNDGELTITVTGKGLKGAADILRSACLTIYLTEDGLVGSQAYGSTTLKKYKHDNVLRQIVTGPSGDAINWNGDDFEETYVVNIPEEWDYSQMHAIAFINNVFAIFDSKGNLAAWNSDDRDVWVSNCNMVEINDGESTGIKNVVPGESKTVVARYAADGTQLAAPVKGINIVKFSDGTSKTVLVK